MNLKRKIEKYNTHKKENQSKLKVRKVKENKQTENMNI